MTRNYFSFFILVIVGASLASCMSKPTPPPPGQQWAEKMTSLSQTLSELLPLVASHSKFNDPKNSDKIEEDTHRLASLAHSLKETDQPSSDPSLKLMGNYFAEDISRALGALHNGNRDYARNVLRDSTSYCIRCHTQTNNGPDFPKLNLKIDMSALSPLEQAEFLAATRQFDPALDAYGKVVANEALAKADPFEWEAAVRSALAITVRVKNDPKSAMALIKTIEKNRSVPHSMKTIVKSWKKSIHEWSRTRPLSPKANLDARVDHAAHWIRIAQKRQKYPLDQSQDVYFFRASSLLHKVLEDPKRKKELSAKALFLAGISTEATRDMGFWTIHDKYYEQCIRALPHSDQAQKCYIRLKDSVTLGYSGSAGVQIPPEVESHLNEFSNLAAPEKPLEKPSEKSTVQ